MNQRFHHDRTVCHHQQSSRSFLTPLRPRLLQPGFIFLLHALAFSLPVQAAEIVYRTTTYTYQNTNYYSKGQLTKVEVSDGEGRKYTEVEHTYVLRNVESGQDLGQPGDADKLTTATLFPQLVRTDRRFYEGQGIAGKATWVTYAYDAVGNVTQYRDYGDVGNGDDVVADIAYSQCQENHIVGKRLGLAQARIIL